MKVLSRLKSTSFLAAGLALSLSMNAGAAPVYLLLQGTIASSVDTTTCQPNCGTTNDARAGQSVTITAVWDDAKFFGTDSDAATNKAHYGGTGFIGHTYENTVWRNPATGQSIPITQPQPSGWVPEASNVDGAHYYHNAPYSGAHSWETDKSWQKYTVTENSNTSAVNFGYTTGADTSPPSWTIDLSSEDNSVTGDLVSFTVTTTSGNSNAYTTSLSLSLTDLSMTALDQNSFGFIWSSSKGGTATGALSFSRSGSGVSGSNTDYINWSRVVLSYNPQDVAAVPLPSSIWMFGTGLLSLFSGVVSRLKKR